MPITLKHTIIPAHDKEASAKFFADIIGLSYEGPMGHFAPVKVNDTFTMDFDNREGFESHLDTDGTGLRTHHHVDAAMFQSLEARDRATELLALLHEGDRRRRYKSDTGRRHLGRRRV